MNFPPNVIWKNKNGSLITSLLIWDDDYIPHQVVIIRKNYYSHISFIFYFFENDMLTSLYYELSDLRTKAENEIEFHMTLKIKSLLDEMRLNPYKTSQENDLNYDLRDLVEEIFMSSIAMEIMKEEHPLFGFYSLSPNLRKFDNVLNGEKDELFESLKKIKRKYQGK